MSMAGAVISMYELKSSQSLVVAIKYFALTLFMLESIL